MNNDKCTVHTFSENDVRYGVRTSHIVEVIEIPEVTVIPCNDRSLRGLFIYKGKVVPVFSFAAICNINSLPDTDTTCLMLNVNGDEVVGITITSANNFVTIENISESSTMECADAIFNGIMCEGSSLMLLDVDRTFSKYAVS